MSYSSLATEYIPSPNRYWGRAYAITKVTIHHMACCWTAHRCGESFLSPSRKASSNYGIGNDGEIACYVDEEDGAWTSADWNNDNRAITIEVSNSPEGVSSGSWAISQAAYNSLIDLCADICERYGIDPYYDGTPYATFTEHRMFASTGCPGPWIHDRMYYICEAIKAAMKPTAEWPVQMWESNGTKAQCWIPHHYADGSVGLESCSVRGKFLDVQWGGTANETQIQIYPANETASQRFRIKQVDNELYVPQSVRPFEIVPEVAPDKRLDVKGGSDVAGTVVQLYEPNGTQAQQWYVLDNGDGTWTLMANTIGKKNVLDVVGGGR